MMPTCETPPSDKLMCAGVYYCPECRDAAVRYHTPIKRYKLNCPKCNTEMVIAPTDAIKTFQALGHEIQDYALFGKALKGLKNLRKKLKPKTTRTVTHTLDDVQGAGKGKLRITKKKTEYSKTILNEYTKRGIKPPNGKGIHTRKFHEISAAVMKDGNVKDRAHAHAIAMAKLGSKKGVKKEHQKDKKDYARASDFVGGFTQSQRVRGIRKMEKWAGAAKTQIPRAMRAGSITRRFLPVAAAGAALGIMARRRAKKTAAPPQSSMGTQQKDYAIQRVRMRRLKHRLHTGVTATASVANIAGGIEALRAGRREGETGKKKLKRAAILLSAGSLSSMRRHPWRKLPMLGIDIPSRKSRAALGALNLTGGLGVNWGVGRILSTKKGRTKRSLPVESVKKHCLTNLEQKTAYTKKVIKKDKVKKSYAVTPVRVRRLISPFQKRNRKVAGDAVKKSLKRTGKKALVGAGLVGAGYVAGRKGEKKRNTSLPPYRAFSFRDKVLHFNFKSAITGWRLGFQHGISEAEGKKSPPVAILS